MRTMIVAGGVVSSAFLREQIEKDRPEFLIAVDRGLDVLLQSGEEAGDERRCLPDLIIGDFDSTKHRDPDALRAMGIPLEIYPADKDFSDLESALHIAVERGSTHIRVLGAAGGRMDHFLANVLDLQIPLSAGIPAYLLDEQNVIFLKDRSFEIDRESCFGKYVSLLPLDRESVKVSLAGFRYSGENIVLNRRFASRGISNEVVEEKAEVLFEGAVLVVVESMD